MPEASRDPRIDFLLLTENPQESHTDASGADPSREMVPYEDAAGALSARSVYCSHAYQEALTTQGLHGAQTVPWRRPLHSGGPASMASGLPAGGLDRIPVRPQDGVRSTGSRPLRGNRIQ